VRQRRLVCFANAVGHKLLDGKNIELGEMLSGQKIFDEFEIRGKERFVERLQLRNHFGQRFKPINQKHELQYFNHDHHHCHDDDNNHDHLHDNDHMIIIITNIIIIIIIITTTTIIIITHEPLMVQLTPSRATRALPPRPRVDPMDTNACAEKIA
jgi:hypothetical protein